MPFKVDGELIGEALFGELYLLPGSGERVQDVVYGPGTVTNIAYVRGLFLTGHAYTARVMLCDGNEDGKKKFVINYQYHKVWPLNIRKLQASGRFLSEKTPDTEDYYPDFGNDRHQRNCCLKEIIVEVIRLSGKPRLAHRLGNEWFWINGRIGTSTN